jgi:hypothetical protein
MRLPTWKHTLASARNISLSRNSYIADIFGLVIENLGTYVDNSLAKNGPKAGRHGGLLGVVLFAFPFLIGSVACRADAPFWLVSRNAHMQVVTRTGVVDASEGPVGEALIGVEHATLIQNTSSNVFPSYIYRDPAKFFCCAWKYGHCIQVRPVLLTIQNREMQIGHSEPWLSERIKTYLLFGMNITRWLTPHIPIFEIDRNPSSFLQDVWWIHALRIDHLNKTNPSPICFDSRFSGRDDTKDYSNCTERSDDNGSGSYAIGALSRLKLSGPNDCLLCPVVPLYLFVAFFALPVLSGVIGLFLKKGELRFGAFFFAFLGLSGYAALLILSKGILWDF